jgi:hypothetical protein
MVGGGTDGGAWHAVEMVEVRWRLREVSEVLEVLKPWETDNNMALVRWGREERWRRGLA